MVLMGLIWIGNIPSAGRYEDICKGLRKIILSMERIDYSDFTLQVDCSKGPDSDKDGFSALVRELSHAFKPKGFLLSSAVSPNKKVIDAGYDVPVLAQHMDWIAVMTYDYHGQWDKKTGHVAPLYYHPEDDNTYFNAVRICFDHFYASKFRR